MKRRYPLLELPENLAGRAPEQWDSRDTRGYLDWLVNLTMPRTSAVLEFLGVEPAGPEETLANAGKRAASLFLETEFSKPSPGPSSVELAGRVIRHDMGPSLTEEGMSLAADMGLLVARFLQETGMVEWQVGRGPRNYVSQNKPVITGPGLTAFDPVGASISNAYGILRGVRNAGIWLQMYTHALDKVRANSGPEPAAKPTRRPRASESTT